MKLNLTSIRIEMAKKNVNQKELAELAGIQGTTISNILTGKSKGAIATWEKIARALEVDVTKVVEN